jgi:serine/threonine protein phosphatase PrpC
MQVSYKSDIGQKRKLNEDSILCLKLDTVFNTGTYDIGLFIIADGMGGHNAGEIASSTATKIIASECLRELLDSQNKTVEEAAVAQQITDALNNSILKANDTLLQLVKSDNSMESMGTTITAALLIGQDLYVAHVGDSRCYIVNDRGITRVTTDHSLVQEMLDKGLIQPEESTNHSQKNVVTRIVGDSNTTQADIYTQKLYDGDTIILCSDGLWGMLTDSTMREIVLDSKTSEGTCTMLIDEANKAGGLDNISVIIIKPEHLPVWNDIFLAETQIKQLSGISNSTEQTDVTAPQKKRFAWFQRK